MRHAETTQTHPGRPAVRALTRGHRAIESLHWIRRDVLQREDGLTVRTPSSPRVIATLRNLAIGAHRVAGPHRHHRSHPLGRTLHGPTLPDPQPRSLILKQPWLYQRA